MQVLKFGGSSVADATAMSRVLDIVSAAAARDRVVLVSSAISGATDLLIKAAESPEEEKLKLLEELKKKHFKIIDRLFTGRELLDTKESICQIHNALLGARREDYQSFGELFSTTILAKKLAYEGNDTLWVNSVDLIRCTEGKVDKELSYKRIQDVVEDHPKVRIFVAPGFIAGDEKGQVCTLGRGGSDYSAALYAAALKADTLQIWTDVPGIMSTNPKEVKKAQTISKLSYQAAFCLASHGAKVLYAPTVAPAQEAGIDIQILNSLNPHQKGSVICEYPAKEEGEWIGIAKKLCEEDGTAELALVADGKIPQQSVEDIQARLHKRDITQLDFRNEGDYLLVKIPASQALDALASLHYFCFEKDDYRQVYLAGKGAVGSALLKIIAESDANIDIRAISAHECEDEAFFKQMMEEASPNSIFVDCTDSESIWKWYVPVLEAGINIVSSNRRALSVPYAEYAAMKRSARLSRRFLRYETTVGTALPVLFSIATSAASSDEILSIEAIVSCTLNYILTSELPFAQALKKAQEIGLTEKDPSQDLLGRDAMRKLLILAREAGVKLEEKDIEIEPVEEEKVKSNQRFVASLVKDDHSPLGYKASIRMKEIDDSHPARSLKGTENMIIIRSTYQPSPLIIQGAGEGAMMAASRVLNDILR